MLPTFFIEKGGGELNTHFGPKVKEDMEFP